jgi:hypothetical protein
MRRAEVLSGVVCVLIATAVTFAQTPNFAGKWTMVVDPSAPAGRGGFGGLGQAATITQDATSITITRTTQAGELTSLYKLDGSESTNTLNTPAGQIDQVSKTKWDGAKLVINSTLNFNGTPVEVSSVLSLDATGNLVVEATRPDFQGGGAPITTKTTYKKN